MFLLFSNVILLEDIVGMEMIHFIISFYRKFTFNTLESLNCESNQILTSWEF